VTLTCHVTAANPAVSEYRFYLNDTVRNTSNSNSLTIIDVQRSKHYGKYKCVAHNDVGDGQSNAVVLNINGKCLSMEDQTHPFKPLLTDKSIVRTLPFYSQFTCLRSPKFVNILALAGGTFCSLSSALGETFVSKTTSWSEEKRSCILRNDSYI